MSATEIKEKIVCMSMQRVMARLDFAQIMLVNYRKMDLDPSQFLDGVAATIMDVSNDVYQIKTDLYGED